MLKKIIFMFGYSIKKLIKIRSHVFILVESKLSNLSLFKFYKFDI